MNNEEKFELLTKNEKDELVMEYVEHLKKDFRTDDAPIEGTYYKYEITLQIYRFVTYVSDEEIEKSARYALELLEEMKKINNSGMDKVAFESLQKKIGEETESEILRVLKVWNEVSNIKIAELMARIQELRRVGGAYAMFVSGPVFISALYSVYEAIVDRFDDAEWYWASGFLLFRAILQMHSESIEE